MEDKETNQPVRPTVPVSRPVMDIQRPGRPQPTTVGEPSKPEVEPAPAEPTTAPTDTSSADKPTEEAKPSFDVKAAMAEANKTPDNQATSDPKDAHAKADQLLAAHAKKSHKPIVPIIIAVVVALALGAVTVFAYLKTQSNTKGEGDHTSTNTTENHSSTNGATTADVEDADKAVDTAAGTNDSTDMPTSDLSDTTLGL